MRTLVLNAGYEPLAVVSFRRAIVLVLAGKATVVADGGNPVVGGSLTLPRPTVILLVAVRAGSARPGRARQPAGSPASGRSPLRLLRRACDHRRPRAAAQPGRRDTWENLVACCIALQQRQGQPDPEEKGWTLRVRPYVPRGPAWVVRGADQRDPAWEAFLGDAA